MNAIHSHYGTGRNQAPLPWSSWSSLPLISQSKKENGLLYTIAYQKIAPLYLGKGQFILLRFCGHAHRERPLRQGTPSPCPLRAPRRALRAPPDFPDYSSVRHFTDTPWL